MLVQRHRVYWEEAGTGTPLICIHTAGQSGLQWRFTLPYFAERGFRAIAVDLPGHGKSLLADWKPISVLHEYAEIVWDLSQGLGLVRPLVMGCSIGANIALDLGVNHPDGVRGLVVCDGAAHTPTVPEGAIQFMLEDAGMPSAGDQAYYGAIGVCGSKAPAERVAEIAWTARSRDPKVQGHDLLGWIHHDLRDHLNRISCPVLLVRGEEDFMLPHSLIQSTHEAISGSELVEIRGIGHFPHMEYPAFLPLVHDFLRTRGLT
ncbi:MAG: alpha/beta fold hydrolase [Alphaproteobacteria bacterium]